MDPRNPRPQQWIRVIRVPEHKIGVDGVHPNVTRTIRVPSRVKSAGSASPVAENPVIRV